MKYKIYSVLIMLSVLTACAHKDSVQPVDFKLEDSSAIEWKGSAPTHFHRGAFNVSGSIETDGKGKIASGDFSIPIASISNFDLTNEAERKQLLDHLKGPDFFNLQVFPEATFHITKVEVYKGEASSVNTMVTGDFKMIGQTHSIQIPVNLKTEKDKISATGSVKLNRLQWGMNSYNDPNEGLYILPDIDITLKLYFRRLGS